MKPEESERLFEEFFRSHSPESDIISTIDVKSILSLLPMPIEKFYELSHQSQYKIITQIRIKLGLESKSKTSRAISEGHYKKKLHCHITYVALSKKYAVKRNGSNKVLASFDTKEEAELFLERNY